MVGLGLGLMVLVFKVVMVVVGALLAGLVLLW